MIIVSANALKTQGVNAFKECFSEAVSEALITVRGVGKYVVMPVEIFQRLQEAELDSAIAEAKHDYKTGKFHTNNIQTHLKRVSSRDI